MTVTQQQISDEELAQIIWGAAAIHAMKVHFGGVDQHCDACTQLCAAIDVIETSMYPRKDIDGATA